MFLPREEGQGLVEYGLILILIAIVAFVAIALVGDRLIPLYERVANALNMS